MAEAEVMSLVAERPESPRGPLPATWPARTATCCGADVQLDMDSKVKQDYVPSRAPNTAAPRCIATASTALAAIPEDAWTPVTCPKATPRPEPAPYDDNSSPDFT